MKARMSDPKRDHDHLAALVRGHLVDGEPSAADVSDAVREAEQDPRSVLLDLIDTSPEPKALVEGWRQYRADVAKAEAEAEAEGLDVRTDWAGEPPPREWLCPDTASFPVPTSAFDPTTSASSCASVSKRRRTTWTSGATARSSTTTCLMRTGPASMSTIRMWTMPCASP